MNLQSNTAVTVILRHAALLAFAVLALNIAIAWHRLPAADAAGILSQAHGRRLLLRVLAFFAVMFGLQEVIVVAAGWPNPLCVYNRPLSDPFVIAMWTVQLLASAWVLWWVWHGSGASTLGRLGPLFAQRADARPYAPTRVRIVVTLMVAGSLLAVALSYSGLKPTAAIDPFCGVPATAA
jgi:hypothetical protein